MKLLRLSAIATLCVNYGALAFVLGADVIGFASYESAGLQPWGLWGGGILNVLLLLALYVRADLDRRRPIIVVGILFLGSVWWFLPLMFTLFGIPLLVLYAVLAIYIFRLPGVRRRQDP